MSDDSKKSKVSSNGSANASKKTDTPSPTKANDPMQPADKLDDPKVPIDKATSVTPDDALDQVRTQRTHAHVPAGHKEGPTDVKQQAGDQAKDLTAEGEAADAEGQGGRALDRVRDRVADARAQGKTAYDKAREFGAKTTQDTLDAVKGRVSSAEDRAKELKSRFDESGYSPASDYTVRNVAIGAAVGGFLLLAIRAFTAGGGDRGRYGEFENSNQSNTGRPSSRKHEPIHKGVQTAIPVGSEVHVRESITVDRPAKELYAKWHRFENLPLILSHLKNVTTLEDGRSYWETEGVTGPVSWYARVTSDVPARRIAWRSEDRADIPNRGEVRFEPTPGGKGTKLTVNLYYNPPGGVFGQALATLFGESPSQQISSDLKRFKKTMEEQAA